MLATDAFCRVRGYEGLYALAGAIVPGAAPVATPALLMIIALVERRMGHIVAALQTRL